MKQPDIVFGFLFPADKNPAKTVQPAVGSLNNPAPGPFSGVCSQLFGFITTGFYMGSIFKFFSKLPNLFKIISFIKTKMLPVVGSWLRTLHSNTVQGCLGKFHIMPVCSIYRKADGNAPAFTQHRTFDTCFAPVSGIIACFFPRPAVLWSWLHPWTAISSQDHADHRIAAVRLSKIDEKHLLPPTPEIVRALLSLSIYRWHQGLSIGSLFLKQTKCRSLPFDTLPAFCRLLVDACLPARVVTVPFCSTAHRKSSSGSLLPFVSCSSSGGFIAMGGVSSFF